MRGSERALYADSPRPLDSLLFRLAYVIESQVATPLLVSIRLRIVLRSRRVLRDREGNLFPVVFVLLHLRVFDHTRFRVSSLPV